MNEYQPQSSRLILLITITVTACLAMVSISWASRPVSWSLQLALVALSAAVLELFASKLPNFTISLTYPLTMCAVVLGGPSACAIVTAVSAVVIAWLERDRARSILLYNFVQTVLIACLTGWAYVALGGRILAAEGGKFVVLSSGDFPKILYGMLAATFVACVMNIILLSIGVSVFRGASFREVFVSAFAFVPAQIALAFVGFLMAQVLAVSVWALPLFAFPLVFAQQIYQRYIAMKNAYVDTVRSLIGALEAKDPYTRGHSERVAEYSAAIGLQMEMDPKGQERLEYAALLHDIGKLAVPYQVLTKPGRLNDDEMHYIYEHPGRGAEMIARIPHFADLAELVGKHHERYGGGGYPSSLDAVDIPLIARILAVADSYDAMTSTRPYRPALSHEVAVSELQKGKGSQFDPEVVEAFFAAGIAVVDVAETTCKPAPRFTTNLVSEQA